MPREPMASGRRAPVDSPTTTSGMPRSVAVRFMCADFLAVGRAGRCALDGEVVDDQRDIAAVDPAVSRELAVGRRFVRLLGIDA